MPLDFSNQGELVQPEQDFGKGNIDLNNRPIAHNEDGSYSTVRSMNFNEGGKEILVPTVVNGKVVSNQEAVDHYHKTGEYLGKFDTPDQAEIYAQSLHENQAKQYDSKVGLDFSAGGTPMDFSSQGEPVTTPTKGNLGESIKATGKEFAAAFDTVASIPGFFAKLGATGVADVVYALKDLHDGGGDPAAQADAWVNKLQNTDAGKYVTSPVSSLLDSLGIKNVTKGTLSEEVFGKISNGIAHIQANTDDPNKQALIGQVANVLQGSVTHIGMGAVKAFDAAKGLGKATEVPANLDEMSAKAAEEIKPVETPPQDFSGQGVIQPEAQQNLPFTGDIQGLERQKDMFTPQQQEHLDATSNQGDLFNKSQGAAQPVTTEAIVQNVEAKPIPEQTPVEQTATQDSLTQDVEQKLQQSSLPNKNTDLSPLQSAPPPEPQQPIVNPDAGVGGKQGGAIGIPKGSIDVGPKYRGKTIEELTQDINNDKEKYFDGQKYFGSDSHIYTKEDALKVVDKLSIKLGQTSIGKSQRGSIGFKPKEPTLQDKAKTMSLEDWSKDYHKTYPQYADNPMVAAKVYDQLRPIEPIPKEINNVKQLVNEKIKDWDGQGNVDQRTVMQGTNALEKLIPKESDRIALYNKIDQGIDKTSPGAKLYRGLADTIWKRAADAGVVKSYVSDYITHMYDFGRQSKSDAMTALYRFADNLEVTRGAGMSTKSQFARERTFQTIQEAATKMGLKPLTTDVSKVYQAYATSMLKAVNNKRLIEELGTVKGKDGYSAIIDRPKDGTVPSGYTTVNHPQWIGKLVDKSIAPTLQSMFDNYNPHALTRIAHSVSIMAKTAIFSFSAFHPMSLVQALAGASRGSSPLLDGIKLYKEFKNSPGGDLVETLQRGGLEIGHPPIDLNPTVAQALVDTSSKFMDKIVPGLGWTTKAPYALAKGLQHVIFGQIQTTFKLGIASQEFARLTLKGIPERKAAEMASTFANDMQGGLNWRRIALDADTKLGSDLANFLASKQGQYHAQIWALAPDWTVATARSWLGAIRKGKDPAEKLMYAKYLAQSAVITAVVMDSLNMHYSGKHFWQNDDPTTVDLGDGRKLQVNKHFMEGVHWIRDFDQTMMNKMGSVPSEFFAQALNKEYLSNQGAPDIIKKQTQIQQLLEPKSKIQELAGNTLKRARHMGSRFVPITAQNVLSGTPEQALSGFAGLPIRGKTTEEKVNEKMQKLMGL